MVRVRSRARLTSSRAFSKILGMDSERFEESQLLDLQYFQFEADGGRRGRRRNSTTPASIKQRISPPPVGQNDQLVQKISHLQAVLMQVVLRSGNSLQEQWEIEKLVDQLTASANGILQQKIEQKPQPLAPHRPSSPGRRISSRTLLGNSSSSSSSTSSFGPGNAFDLDNFVDFDIPTDFQPQQEHDHQAANTAPIAFKTEDCADEVLQYLVMISDNEQDQQDQVTEGLAMADFQDDEAEADASELPPGSYDLIELDAMEILAEHTHFCDLCGKGFKRDANLRMHMRGHGDEYKTVAALSKPKLQDSTIQQQPEQQLNPQTTMMIKTKRYSCPFVGCKRNKLHPKFLPLKTVLCVKNHYRRSHCPKMLTCSKCKSKKFSVVADLRTHEKHCGREKWQCSCGTKFSRKDKLMGHVSLFSGHKALAFGERSVAAAVAAAAAAASAEDQVVYYRDHQDWSSVVFPGDL